MNLPTNRNELYGQTEQEVKDLIAAISPTDKGEQVIAEGDPLHKHTLSEVEWDSKHGKSMVDIDKDPGTEIAFPMATFRDRYKCECGHEIITSRRSLV